MPVRTHVCVSTCRMVIDHMYKQFFLRFLTLHVLTKHVKPLHSLLSVCVYVYVYVCVSVCVYLYLHEQGRRTKVHVLQAVFLSSSVICLPVCCTYTCQLETSNIYVLKNQGGDIARSK